VSARFRSREDAANDRRIQPRSLHEPSLSTITGHCLCSAVTITVAGEHDPRVGACHCRMCQRWSGGLFLCFTADASAATVTGEVTHYPPPP
jgi:hypothetical protein